MSAEPPPRLPPKPRITLQIPPYNQQQPPPSPYINPMTARAQGGVTGQPQWPPYASPFNMYNTKAGEFMFKQFEGFKDFTISTAKSGLNQGEKSAFWMYSKVSTWSKKWFTHIFLFLVVLCYSLAGAAIFVAVEGSHEEREILDIRQERYDLVRDLRNLSNDKALLENPEQWEGAAVARMRIFEAQLYTSYKHGVSDTGKKVWGFWNAMFYCGTIYTTIGYGHISPVTTTGRAITIVYAIIGIPMFLILLADFGKLFTRCIKFVWAYVRRLYYTGSCKKVRRTAPMQEVMKGFNMVYDLATFRRPSQIAAMEASGIVIPPELQAAAQASSGSLGVPLGHQSPQGPPNRMGTATINPIFLAPPGAIGADTPQTPAPSNFEIDDDFNLPISIAIVILLAYIFIGATIYYIWEEWGFFESFYFVFISMSTIGFGDFVPKHPMYMMASIVYLVFGLALTSMCINVVQLKLSDSFRQASAKIGATIGLKMAEGGDGFEPTEEEEDLAEVHTSGIPNGDK